MTPESEGLENEQGVGEFGTCGEAPEAGVEGYELTGVAVGEHQKLHIGELIVANEAGPLGDSQVSKIYVDGPVGVVWAGAVLFEASECEAEGGVRPAELCITDPQEACLGERASCPATVRLFGEPVLGGPV